MTTVDGARHESGHALPEFLPDGRRFLFFVQSQDAAIRGVYLSSLDAPNTRQRVLSSETKASYVPPHDGKSGMLLFVRGSTLVAQPFDVDQARPSGEPVVVAEGLALWSLGQGFTGHAPFWNSPAGVLLYRVGTVSYSVNWIDRNGRRSPSGMPNDHYLDMRLSPDSAHVAICRPKDNSDLWQWDLWQWEFRRDAWTKLTAGESYANFPAWSGDGSQVIFSSTSPTQALLVRKRADNSVETEQVLKGESQMVVQDWSRDGRFLLYQQRTPGPAPNISDVWALRLKPLGTPYRLIYGPSIETSAKFSPVGHFVAFTSNESGREEVYVQPLAETASGTLALSGQRVPISRSGGSTPLWRGDGRELYFISADNKMMAAAITPGSDAVTVGAIHELFGATFMTLNVQPYDVTPDGQRFLVLEPQDRSLHPPFTVAVNWQDALVPEKR